MSVAVLVAYTVFASFFQSDRDSSARTSTNSSSSLDEKSETPVHNKNITNPDLRQDLPGSKPTVAPKVAPKADGVENANSSEPATPDQIEVEKEPFVPTKEMLDAYESVQNDLFDLLREVKINHADIFHRIQYLRTLDSTRNGWGMFLEAVEAYREASKQSESSELLWLEKFEEYWEEDGPEGSRVEQAMTTALIETKTVSNKFRSATLCQIIESFPSSWTIDSVVTDLDQYSVFLLLAARVREHIQFGDKNSAKEEVEDLLRFVSKFKTNRSLMDKLVSYLSLDVVLELVVDRDVFSCIDVVSINSLLERKAEKERDVITALKGEFITLVSYAEVVTSDKSLVEAYDEFGGESKEATEDDYKELIKTIEALPTEIRKWSSLLQTLIGQNLDFRSPADIEKVKKVMKREEVSDLSMDVNSVLYSMSHHLIKLDAMWLALKIRVKVQDAGSLQTAEDEVRQLVKDTKGVSLKIIDGSVELWPDRGTDIIQAISEHGKIEMDEAFVILE